MFSKVICTDSLAAYPLPLFTLIPLHAYDATRTKRGKKRKVGKAPRDNKWTTASYNSRKVLASAIESNTNVGVRLSEEQLVLDVDPRNGGTEGFAKLCRALGIDPTEYPTCVTGSGGLHLYMSKPAGLLIVDTLEDYPGVEFKSKGRQVVAAGSIHPDTKKHYEWDALTPPIVDGLPDAPEALLNIIARPARDATIKGGGQMTQEQVADALSRLDPENYRDHAAWLKIMMACHHASNGDARHEFVEWSTSDPQYAEDSEVIGRRWDSLHMQRDHGGDVITFRSLLQEVREHGDGEAFDFVDEEERDADFEALADAAEEEGTKAPWEEDFEGVKSKSKLPGGEDDGVKAENPGGYDDAATSLLEGLNAEYQTVEDGGKFRVVFQKYEPVLKRKSWVRMAPMDFMLQYSNHRVERTAEELEKLSKSAATTQPLGKAWIEWPLRKHYKGLIFDPKKDAHHKGYLNTWTGFAYQASERGSWKYLNQLIYDVLAEGSDINHAYIINWLRFLFQHPEQRAECAVVFKGGKGVGKGTLGNAVTRLIGHHAISVGSAALITGRFNSHFQDLLFLFADEAVKPHDKQGESMLKNLITEPLVAYEGKGRDVVQGPNFLHVMMASNEQWVVPASPDERRYFVTECNVKYQRDKGFFDKLHDELTCDNDSGYRRLLWDLLTTPMPKGFHPRDYPLTAALVDQKVRSQSVLSQFFFDALNEAVTPFRVIKGDWHKGAVRVFVSEFRDAYTSWQRERGINSGAMGRGNMRFVFQELQQLFPSAKLDLREPVAEEWEGVIQAAPSDGRAKAIELPRMTDCKQFFRDSFGGDCFSPTVEEPDFG